MIDLPLVLRAITLHPWWAWDVVHGGKRMEYRTRPIPGAMVGVPIALHAGQPSKPFKKHGPWSKKSLAADELGAPVVQWSAHGFGPRDGRSVFGGAIVAIVVFGDTVASEHLPMPWRCAEFVGWPIKEVFALPDPVECRGAQGFWAVNDAERESVERQIVRRT